MTKRKQSSKMTKRQTLNWTRGQYIVTVVGLGTMAAVSATFQHRCVGPKLRNTATGWGETLPQYIAIRSTVWFRGWHGVALTHIEIHGLEALMDTRRVFGCGVMVHHSTIGTGVLESLITTAAGRTVYRWIGELIGAGMTIAATIESHLSVSGKCGDFKHWWRCVYVHICKISSLCVDHLIWPEGSITRIISYYYFISIAVMLLKERSDKWHKQELDCLSGLVPLIRADWVCFEKNAFSTLFWRVNSSCNYWLFSLSSDLSIVFCQLFSWYFLKNVSQKSKMHLQM